MTNQWRTIAVQPDVHVPIHHVKGFNNFLTLVKDLQPDEIINIGDFLDCKAPARWSKGTADEFAGTLQAECDLGRSLLTATREVFDGPYTYIEGNHEARIRSYLDRYAPALSDLSALSIESLLALDEHGVEYTQHYKFAPGWIAIHGDKLSQKAGESAMKMVDTLGLSVVQGHSHRAGIMPKTNTKTYFGVEVGHLSDIRKQSYLGPLRAANWQLAFGILHTRGSVVHPEIVFVNADGSFRYQGVDYK